MSLGLKDLKREKKKPLPLKTDLKTPPPEVKLPEPEPPPVPAATVVAKSLISKKKVLRPWESFDHLEDQTRTIRAKEALERAKAAKGPVEIPLGKEEEELFPPLPAFASPALSPFPHPEKRTFTPGPQEKLPGLFGLFFHLIKM